MGQHGDGGAELRAGATYSPGKVRATCMRTLRLLSLTLLAAALAGALPAFAAQSKPCGYQDLMPAYERFSTHTAALAPEQRAAAFVKDFAARHPDYYAPEVFGDEAKMQASAARFFDPVRRAAAFPDFPPLTPERIAAMGRAVGAQFAEQQRRFIHTFADFHCETEVEFGPSLLKFDGHPVEFDGKSHLLFGVDVIAAVHEPADMSAFFDHEIFHLYHRQVIATRAPRGDDPAWWTMWVEGLATYVSQRMNPGLDAQQVLWFPKDMVARMQLERVRAAKLMLLDIDKSGSDADRWFLGSKSVEGLPSRAGYYLGYLFSRSVGEGEALPLLARMAPAEVHEREISFLTELAHTDDAIPRGSGR
jgi:hypothetical protein